VDRKISDQAWLALSKRLGLELAVLQAVADVESAGNGFLKSGEPKILFEGHAFDRLTKGRFRAAHPDLSYPTWTKIHYAKTGEGEWQRLVRARALERDAANQSASWGAFQIMGFNYGLCGFSDVESFVSAMRAGPDEQLEAFAQFIARDKYLTPLRKQDWATFAAAYNGPLYAKNKYDTRLAAAYATRAAAAAPVAAVAAGAAGAAPKGKKGNGKSKVVVMPPAPSQGRREFAPPPPAKRRFALRKSVKPDAVDLRDWLYRPTIAQAPPMELWPHDPRPTMQQGETSACTGFSLALVIEYLLDKARRPVEPISGFMLYSMARRYDEWADNDPRVDEDAKNGAGAQAAGAQASAEKRVEKGKGNKKDKGKKADDDGQADRERQDTGSSLRGALKGWSRHGASAARLWDTFDPPDASNVEDGDWWLDSVRRPLGAYYRLSLDSLNDLQIALMESGAIYVSALTHGGWEELFKSDALPPPTNADEIPIIECRPGLEDGGHAFAVVGYTDKGFVVHNSWGPEWGRGGFAILTYSDWRQNAMDAWVVQLGVVTREHEAVSRASSLRRADASGRIVLASNSTLASHEVSPFVVDMENEGRLSERGQFRTFPSDLEFLLEHHLQKVAVPRWGIKKNDVVDVAIYAHGGMVSEESAASSARRWVPLLYSNKIFPVFLMWETDLTSTVFAGIEDELEGQEPRMGGGWWQTVTSRLRDWKDDRIEGITRGPGGVLWRQMKDNARDISSTEVSGVVKLFTAYTQRQKNLPRVRLHLIGHSAGAIVHTYLGAAALKLGFEIATINLIAPAVRVDDFNEHLGKDIARLRIPTLLVHLTDDAERKDPTCSPYGRSLLYLVSRAFEEDSDTAVLGMEKHLVPSLVSHDWGEQITRLSSPGASFRPGDRVTVAATHPGLDDDTAVQDAIIRHIKGEKFKERILRPTTAQPRDTVDPEREPFEERLVEVAISGQTPARAPRGAPAAALRTSGASRTLAPTRGTRKSRGASVS
jgi:hypothetical protein